MTKDLRIEATLYLPMQENETQNVAEDRLMALLSSIGVEISEFSTTIVDE